MRAAAGVIVAWLGLAATAAVAAPPAPRGPHPRIFLTPPTLAALKVAATRSDPGVTSALELCRHAALEPKAFASSGYQGADWAFAASSCGLAWRLTGDPSFAKAGIRLWRALMEDVATIGDKKACVPRRSPQTWQASIRRDTGYAIRFVGPHAALAYDWLYDAPGVDDALRRESHDCFVSWIDWYTKTGYLNDEPGANYHAGFVLAKALVAVALAGDDPRGDRLWSEVVDDAFGAQIVGRGLAGASGAPQTDRPGPLVGGDWPEGWQYGPLSVIEYALGARALEEHGVKLPAVDHWASEVALRVLYATTPAGDELYPGGDHQATTFYLPNEGAGLLATIAGPGSAEAAGWAAAVLRRFPQTWTTAVFGALAAARGVAPHDFLEKPRPLWYLAPGTSNVYVRSAWDPGAFWAVFTSSRRLVADHQHPDATNFVFMRGRDHLIVDPSPYGCQSTLAANAATCDSAVVEGDYKPSQTPWSNAALSFVRATRSGVAAARGDFHAAFNFSETPSDIPFAQRDWVFLPEGEIVTIDRVDTGARTRKTYLRFRTPAHLTLAKGTRFATGVSGQSAIAIHSVTLSGGAPVVLSVPVADCDQAPFGSCRGARLPVDEYAVEVPGPKAIAVHVIDGLDKNERPASVAPIGEGLLGAAIKRGGHTTFVVASPTVGPGTAATLRYTVAGEAPARHVVFDAPAGSIGRSEVRARAAGGRCQISIGPAGGGAGLVGSPLVFDVTTADNGCAVAEDLSARSASIP